MSEVVVEFGIVTATASGRSRSALAVHLLKAAATAARRVHEVEAENADADFGNYFNDIVQHASVSVVMSAGALEANANEIISDILDAIEPLTVTQERRELLADLRGGMAGPEEKYRQLALLLDRTPDRGIAAWQDISLLIRFRNDLMHFRPAWDNDEEVHRRMRTRMESRLDVSRFFRTNFVYPYGLFTSETARRSVRMVLAFDEYFSALVGIRKRFCHPAFDYTLQ